MNKSLFYQYLHYPELLDERSLVNINKIIEEYPYFQSARLLNVKNLSNQGHIGYDRELKDTAVWAIDRRKLFYLLDTRVLISIGEDEKNLIRESLTTINFDKLTEITFVEGEDKDEDLSQLIDTGSVQMSNYFDLMEVKNEEVDLKENTAKDRKSKLIDDFITRKPKIIPISKEEEEIKTKVVNVEEPVMITDTLAKIYIKQEKYDKAILAYNKLSLKYPEKSSYFDSQIEKIKQLINNK
jgi:hypothetical protein